MVILLVGGPFDGHEVEPSAEGVPIPDSLGFDRRGVTVVGVKDGSAVACRSGTGVSVIRGYLPN